MTRLLIPAALLLWVGATLLLSQLRWFSRAPLDERLRPYVSGGLRVGHRVGLLSVESFREAVAPIAAGVGERVSKLFGVTESAAVRLARIHSPLDLQGFRTRQLGFALAGFGGGALLALALGFPLALVAAVVLAAPLLGFLVLEQQLANASKAWQRRVFLELPVITEQLAMLLSSGYSLTSALNRVSSRSRGSCAQDLARVCGRIRQGLSEGEALKEWADLLQVDAVDRLVPLLALNREASDLGRLLSEEARAIRRDVQRELIEEVEKRAQQVWVPVTVATLVPGVIFLSVPLIAALNLFAG